MADLNHDGIDDGVAPEAHGLLAEPMVDDDNDPTTPPVPRRPISAIKGLRPVLQPAEGLRTELRTQVVASLGSLFPVVKGGWRLEANNIRVEPKTYYLGDVKDAIVKRKDMAEPVRADLRIVEEKTGKVVDKGTKTLLHLPYVNNQHTFILAGTPYTVASQPRLRPGVFTRIQDNGEVVSAFNLERGKNFKLVIEPSTGVLAVQYASSKTPLLALLRGLGVPDADIIKAWGKPLFEANRRGSDGKENQALAKIYEYVIPPHKQEKGITPTRMREILHQSYRNSVVDPQVMQATLGQKFESISPAVLLAASRKLVMVYRREAEPDDREDLAVKTLHTPATFFGERIEKDARRAVMSKVQHKLAKSAQPKLDHILPSGVFTPHVKSFLTSSPLSSTPSQINPLEGLDSVCKVTLIGEGGISSLRAVPNDARDLHPSHIGIFDMVRTPESGGVGVDLRVASQMRVDEWGTMYAPMIDARTRRPTYVPVHELSRSKVAFQGTDMSRPRVPALWKGVTHDVKSSEVDFIVPSTLSTVSPATAMVPIKSQCQGNRLIMGSKHATQALPLVHREAPWVQVATTQPGQTVEKTFGRWHLPICPVDGVVSKIDHDRGFITIKGDDHKEYAVEFAVHFPYASKTELHHELHVKVGDRVKKDQILADSNYTKDGTMALGTHLRAAFLSWKGLNTNDAIVVSESAANKKLVTAKMMRETVYLGRGTVLDPGLHRRYFGHLYPEKHYQALDSRGVIRKGAVVEPGQLLVAACRERPLSAQDQMLGRLSTKLSRPMSNAGLTWSEEVPGTITEVHVDDTYVTLLISCTSPLVIGDKITGQHGNKGVVAAILPDDQMPHDEQGRPLELLATAMGVNSRINYSQVSLMALGKMAEKTGKVVEFDDYPRQDVAAMVSKMVRKAGVKDKETVTDPTTGRKIPNIHVGPLYFLRSFKETDTSFAARGVGPGYDLNEQPTKGGSQGAKALGRMDAMALIAHGARGLAREVSIKGQPSVDFWQRMMTGQAEGAVQPSFAFDRFKSMLTGAGIGVKRQGDAYMLTPLTDKDVDRLATHPIQNAGVFTVKVTKDGPQLNPDKGGLFDPLATGGPGGKLWSRIDLPVAIVNPVFADSAMGILGMSSKQFDDIRYNQGAEEIKRRLNAVNLETRQAEVDKEIKRLLGQDTATALASVDRLVRTSRAIKALRQQGLAAGDAYVNTKIPVVPPAFRPVTAGQSGTVIIADANHHYKDLLLTTQAVSKIPEELRTPETMADARRKIEAAVKAVAGLGPAVSPKTEARGVKGHLQVAAGVRTPKEGFFQANLVKREQDLSARATIAPDPKLGMDQIRVPWDMAVKVYAPHVVRRLVAGGLRPDEATKRVAAPNYAQDHAVMDALGRVMTEVPILFSRAPALHRYNLVAAWPLGCAGHTVYLSPFYEQLGNADYDGDAVTLHVPVTQQGINEAKRLVISHLAIGDRNRSTLLAAPQHDAVVGAFLATRDPDPGAPKVFATLEDAHKAFLRGEITYTTPIEIKAPPTYKTADADDFDSAVWQPKHVGATVPALTSPRLV